MATTFKWTTVTDRSGSTGGGQTTELNAVANNTGFSAAPAGYVNSKAAEAIEAYRDGILYGEFWVRDRHHAGEHRGYFKRWPS